MELSQRDKNRLIDMCRKRRHMAEDLHEKVQEAVGPILDLEQYDPIAKAYLALCEAIYWTEEIITLNSEDPFEEDPDVRIPWPVFRAVVHMAEPHSDGNKAPSYPSNMPLYAMRDYMAAALVLRGPRKIIEKEREWDTAISSSPQG